MKKWLNTKSIAFWTRASLSVLLFTFISIYTFVQMREILYGVDIKANISDYIESTHISQISGQAKNAIYLTINGREISVDKDGSFTENMALPYGFSIITLVAKDQFGKIIEKTMEVYTTKERSVAYQIKNKDL